MELDLLASIEMTACAASAIAVLAIGFGTDTATRVRIATGLGIWFVLVAAMAATNVLDATRGLGVPGLATAVLLPIIIMTVGTLRSPTLSKALRAVPLHWLVGVNFIRTFGIIFLILHAAGRLPAPFAPVAGWGDIAVGLLAIPVAWFAYKQGAAANSTVFVWNSFGLLDLITAVGLGATSSPGPLHFFNVQPSASIMTSLPWLLIPGFLVPLLATTHLALFYRLLAPGTRGRLLRGEAS